jgi:hypothetical protein
MERRMGGLYFVAIVVRADCCIGWGFSRCWRGSSKVEEVSRGKMLRNPNNIARIGNAVRAEVDCMIQVSKVGPLLTLQADCRSTSGVKCVYGVVVSIAKGELLVRSMSARIFSLQSR